MFCRVVSNELRYSYKQIKHFSKLFSCAKDLPFPYNPTPLYNPSKSPPRTEKEAILDIEDEPPQSYISSTQSFKFIGKRSEQDTEKLMTLAEFLINQAEIHSLPTNFTHKSVKKHPPDKFTNEVNDLLEQILSTISPAAYRSTVLPVIHNRLSDYLLKQNRIQEYWYLNKLNFQLNSKGTIRVLLDHCFNNNLEYFIIPLLCNLVRMNQSRSGNDGLMRKEIIEHATARFSEFISKYVDEYSSSIKKSDEINGEIIKADEIDLTYNSWLISQLLIQLTSHKLTERLQLDYPLINGSINPVIHKHFESYTKLLRLDPARHPKIKSDLNELRSSMNAEWLKKTMIPFNLEECSDKSTKLASLFNPTIQTPSTKYITTLLSQHNSQRAYKYLDTLIKSPTYKTTIHEIAPFITHYTTRTNLPELLHFIQKIEYQTPEHHIKFMALSQFAKQLIQIYPRLSPKSNKSIVFTEEEYNERLATIFRFLYQETWLNDHIWGFSTYNSKIRKELGVALGDSSFGSDYFGSRTTKVEHKVDELEFVSVESVLEACKIFPKWY